MKRHPVSKQDKLQLNRETLRVLETAELTAKVGGASTISCGAGTCAACGTLGTCGTRLC